MSPAQCSLTVQHYVLSGLRNVPYIQYKDELSSKGYLQRHLVMFCNIRVCYFIILRHGVYPSQKVTDSATAVVIGVGAAMTQW